MVANHYRGYGQPIQSAVGSVFQTPQVAGDDRKYQIENDFDKSQKQWK